MDVKDVVVNSPPSLIDEITVISVEKSIASDVAKPFPMAEDSVKHVQLLHNI